MQTFLPYKSFVETAKCLDYKRLGKQRVEAMQIYNAIYNPFNRWRRHPTVLMWKNYSNTLLYYGMAMSTEWIFRGYKDNLFRWFYSRIDGPNVLPSWLDGNFCLSHRSNLIRKNPDHYKKFWPDVSDDLFYVWPVRGSR